MKSSILTFSVLAIMVVMTISATSFADQTVLARGSGGSHGGHDFHNHHGGGFHHGHGGFHHGGHGGGHFHHGGNGGGGYWVNNGGDNGNNGYWVNNGDNGGNMGGGIFVPNNSGYSNTNPAYSAGVQAGINACQNSNN